jgi:peptidoglycan/LPS O-acetylase OafA/YrhL
MFPLLAEKPILNLDKLDGCGAFFVVVSHAVHPSAHGIAPHQPGIVGHQGHAHSE